MLVSHFKMILGTIIVSFFGGIIYFLILKIRRQSFEKDRFWYRWLFTTYLLSLFSLTLLPLPGPNDFLTTQEPHYILRPFAFLQRIRLQLSAHPLSVYRSLLMGLLTEDVIMQPILNILLMLPLGYYLAYFKQKPIRKIILITVLLSLTIELLQLTGLLFLYQQPYRLFEIDDLMLNTIGGICGSWLGQSLQKNAIILNNKRDQS